MGIAEEYLLWEILIHVGGIRCRLFDQLVLFRRRVLFFLLVFLPKRRAARQDDERCGERKQISDYAVQFRLCIHFRFLFSFLADLCRVSIIPA